MQMLRHIIERITKTPKLSLAVVIALAAAATLLWLRKGKSETVEATFEARRGNLSIRILEGGNVEALEAQEIRSGVKGPGTKILKIVEEGYLVTEEDVKNGKVLVELDSSDLRQRLINQDIQFQSTLAAYIDAQQDYDIVFNQNKADIQAAQQKARFARMDVEKFLGTKVAAEIIKLRKLYEDTNDIQLPDVDAFLASIGTNSVIDSFTNSRASASTLNDWLPKNHAASNQPAAISLGASLNALLTDPDSPPPIDYSRYADSELLGDGAAKQQLRKLMDDLQLAQAQLSLSRTKLEGTRRLFEKKFVTKNELDTEELNFRNNQLRVDTAQTALDLYIKYEFPKQAEEIVSQYENALRSLTQTRKAAIAKLAQYRAKLKSAEGKFKLEAEQRRDLLDQLDKCIIRAEKCGLVVYASESRMFDTDQIREGGTVRERQKIITIPDMTQMCVKIKVHEGSIKKVKTGLPARITVDAYADEELTGEVFKVSMLPDYQNRWLNPDLKVYITTVKINQSREWLKPGMSAKVEILVRELTNVVYIPIQSVSMSKDRHYCFVQHPMRIEKRQIEIGDFNDEFIEVKRGLAEGEKVLLHPPEGEPVEPAPPENEEPEKEVGQPPANGNTNDTDSTTSTNAPASTQSPETQSSPSSTPAPANRRQ